MDHIILTLLIFIVIAVAKGYDQTEPKPRIINKSGNRRPEFPIPAQSGEIVYEDESEFHADQMDEGPLNQPYYQQSHVPHIPFSESMSFGSLSKRYGHSIFGDDFALFLVLLTIAGFFGLIMYLLLFKRLISMQMLFDIIIDITLSFIIRKGPGLSRFGCAVLHSQIITLTSKFL